MLNEHNQRMPKVAGQFYPAAAKELREQIKRFSDTQLKKKDVIACVLPHAGYVYSGYVATQTVSQIIIKNSVVLLGPNHTGLGAPFSIMTKGAWLTPFGEVKIDNILAQAILKQSRELKEDSLAHAKEHSLEVELPILQYFRPDFQIVPMVFSSSNFESLKKIGREIASSIKELKKEKDSLIIASSDLTHYEPQAQAKAKDNLVIAAILELNEDKLIENISRYNISMCGYAPVSVMLSAAKALGAKNAELIKYQTSGDVTNDTESVVGYAGIILY